MPALDPSANRVTLRPRFFDRLCVTLLLLPGLFGIVLVANAFRTNTKDTVHCDRFTGQCDLYGATVFGGQHNTIAMDKLWLAHSTAPEEARAAEDFRAFLADPKRNSFDTSFQRLKIPPLPAALALCLPFLFFAFRWWRGWYAELELAGDEVILRQHPMFFTGPRERRIAKTDAQLVEAVENRYIGRGQRAKFARFELRSQEGQRLFRYSTLYDKKSRAVLDGYMQLLSRFFSES